MNSVLRSGQTSKSARFNERKTMAIATNEKKSMKAIQIHAVGGPDVLQYEDVPRPEPKPNEVLVRVHAAGVNPVDWKIREGVIPSTLPIVMGIDLSGVVESVGGAVTKFRAGDEVFGQVAEES